MKSAEEAFHAKSDKSDEGIGEEIERLNGLCSNGIISVEEFESLVNLIKDTGTVFAAENFLAKKTLTEDIPQEKEEQFVEVKTPPPPKFDHYDPLTVDDFWMLQGLANTYEWLAVDSKTTKEEMFSALRAIGQGRKEYEGYKPRLEKGNGFIKRNPEEGFRMALSYSYFRAQIARNRDDYDDWVYWARGADQMALRRWGFSPSDWNLDTVEQCRVQAEHFYLMAYPLQSNLDYLLGGKMPGGKPTPVVLGPWAMPGKRTSQQVFGFDITRPRYKKIKQVAKPMLLAATFASVHRLPSGVVWGPCNTVNGYLGYLDSKYGVLENEWWLMTSPLTVERLKQGWDLNWEVSSRDFADLVSVALRFEKEFVLAAAARLNALPYEDFWTGYSSQVAEAFKGHAQRLTKTVKATQKDLTYLDELKLRYIKVHNDIKKKEIRDARWDAVFDGLSQIQITTNHDANTQKYSPGVGESRYQEPAPTQPTYEPVHHQPNNYSTTGTCSIDGCNLSAERDSGNWQLCLGHINLYMNHPNNPNR
jgi:hypothetical protein